MIDIQNQTNKDYNTTIIEQITNSLTNKDIELVITYNDSIQKINREYRNIDKPTDVLSFPYTEAPFVPLGSIVISADFVEQKAKELGHSEQDEFTLLYIHGLLHVMGYDHEIDNGEMRQKEAAIIQKYNLPESLIVRTEK
ncbi:MAG: rRNA maturation RNase YbeY [Epsilonproteobacteria bacterium]|nr:rRNA maturation RNase YbeY [Campylobacterota bacterium]